MKKFSFVFGIIAMIMFAFGFSACEKESALQNSDNTSEYATDVDLVDDVNLVENENSNENNVSRTSYNYQTYYVSSAYKNAYQHYQQPTSQSCSWTSYVLAVASIVRGKGDYSYPYNGSYLNKIDHVRTTCNNSKLISKLAWYCQNYDNPTYNISRWLRTSSTYNGALDIILDHRAYNDTPFLYIGSVGSIGHYLIIWDVDWTGNTTTSTVWYTDVNQNIVNNSRSYSNNVLTTTIDALLSQNVMTYYNFLCLY